MVQRTLSRSGTWPVYSQYSAWCDNIQSTLSRNAGCSGWYVHNLSASICQKLLGKIATTHCDQLCCRNESRSHTESGAKSSASHVTFSVASGESNFTSLSTAHARNHECRRLRWRGSYVSQYSVHTFWTDTFHDTVPNAASHSASSWSANSKIRAANAQSSARSFYSSASSFGVECCWTSQINAVAQAYTSNVNTWRSYGLEESSGSMGAIKKRSTYVVSILSKCSLCVAFLVRSFSSFHSFFPLQPFSSTSTPRYEESRRTPRNYEESVGRTTPRNRTSNRTPSYKSPRGTPHTNSSPRSMSLSGDGTPLYDES